MYLRSSRHLTAIVLAAGLITVLSAACGPVARSGSPTSGTDDQTPRVVRVIDGDTIIARVNGTDERIRLIGVDTPETKDPRKPVQCFGKEASDFTSGMLPPGTAIRLERDVEERDRYDRLLAYVHRLDDDVFINRELIVQGYAQPLTIPPNVTFADEFAALAAEARDAGRGLWGACAGPGATGG